MNTQHTLRVYELCDARESEAQLAQSIVTSECYGTLPPLLRFNESLRHHLWRTVRHEVAS